MQPACPRPGPPGPGPRVGPRSPAQTTVLNSFDEAIAQGEDERRRYRETLWRFVFNGNLVGGMFNADPHPGNFVHPALLFSGLRVALPDHAALRRQPGGGDEGHLEVDYASVERGFSHLFA